MGGLDYGNDVTVDGANRIFTTGQALMNYGTSFGRSIPTPLALASNRGQPLHADELRTRTASGP